MKDLSPRVRIRLSCTMKDLSPRVVGPRELSSPRVVQDWQQAGLLKPSLLKPLIATLEKNQIVKVMGQLSNADRNKLEKVIQTILGAE